jgi:eukaryotic-like serine/threonine-protein kinase
MTMGAPFEKPLPWVIGRYALHGQIASGGMASVHLGRLVGPGGFGRTVAIKRLHPQYAKDPEFVAMFLDEARLAARVQHPNVVPTIDIIAMDGELFLVMEHVQGEALSRLARSAQRTGEPIPLPIVSAIISGALNGLHAAHETKDEKGKSLGIVHRDVSPQNILVGVDGVARVLDFGVAKAGGRIQTTQEGQIKGKLAYMAPEQLRQNDLDRTADLYAAAVVLWETLTLERLFKGDNQAQVVAKVLAGRIPRPSEVVRGLPPELDAVTARGLERDPTKRFATGREMASALERAVRPATPTEVGAWVQVLAAEPLQRRSDQISDIESHSDVTSGVATQAKQFLAELATGPRLPPTEEEPKSAKTERSSVGVASQTERPARAGSRRTIWLVVGAVTMIGVGVVAARSAWRSPSLSVPPASATAASHDPPAAPQSPPGATTSTLPVSEPPTPVTSPTPIASQAPAASPAPAPVRAPPSRRAAPAPPSRAAPAVAASPTVTVSPSIVAPPAQVAAKPTKDCDPPYVIDSSGEKHYKKECF